ncbi:thermonuclease family protein [Bradyrhizobium sp. INPA01-394B]|uniref:Thermonuclease family protein n=1 Tax=Bradyrhizobium campsiandrae TaxID=1729892 RepID=A0ABR7ULS9_9BRAD|nr:thermonuclease family protein [Bradyrhizobium campsiandrae]MBC9883701.1 thermonuclease family protein [Bradyrhizobium campsiandrae]MBC9984389.1 thermonuclease family protein [Bradyrhizobium campsiandrae]
MANSATDWDWNRTALLSLAGVDNPAGELGQGMKCFTLIFAAILFSTLSVRAEPVSVDAITVVDGDTIEIGSYRYRLVGYDTPEIKTRRRKVTADERALAMVAKERFTELLHSGPVDLVEVVCSCPAKTIGIKKCNYGRKCGRLTLNGKNIGEMLIGEELAQLFVCWETSCPEMPDWPKIIEKQFPSGRAL